MTRVFSGREMALIKLFDDCEYWNNVGYESMDDMLCDENISMKWIEAVLKKKCHSLEDDLKEYLDYIA